MKRACVAVCALLQLTSAPASCGQPSTSQQEPGAAPEEVGIRPRACALPVARSTTLTILCPPRITSAGRAGAAGLKYVPEGPGPVERRHLAGHQGVDDQRALRQHRHRQLLQGTWLASTAAWAVGWSAAQRMVCHRSSSARPMTMPLRLPPLGYLRVPQGPSTW